MTNDVTNPKDLKPYDRWSQEVISAEKEIEKFHKRARLVCRKFLDERETMSTSNKWFNIFYANVGIMTAALYANLPKPSVDRKFKDYNDDVARVAALIIERSITQDLDDPRDTFDRTMRQCVQDRLVPGLGMAWLRLETDTETIEDTATEGITPQPDMETEEVGEKNDQDQPMQRITDQRVVTDYIFWEDFLWSPCRVWDERRWVGRKVYMDREELTERWPEKGGQVPLDYKPEKFINSMTPKFDEVKKAVIYEIWDRTQRKVIWFAQGMTELLEEADDPLGLVGFEPCPMPMFANVSTSNSVPRPDYYMIQDQYTELDDINNRISMLITACKVVGVYDRAAAGVQRMLQEGTDNTLIPVDNWALFSEKNGLKGQIDWLPIDTVLKAIDQLNQARDIIKAQIYEITGISDIVRGASKASETLGAQEIKSKFAGIRIKNLQNEVARFAADILRIKAELQIKHFAPEILIKKSNIMITGNDQFVGPAIQLLQDEEGFEWRITVTADSLAQADYADEKTARNEFLTTFTNFLTKILPLGMQNPRLEPLIAGIMRWSIAGYSGANVIEGMLDKELDALSRPQPPKPPPPNPDAQKAQMEIQIMQQQAQLESQKMQMEMQMAQQKNQMDLQAQQANMAMKQKEMEMDLQIKRMDLQLEAQKMGMELQNKRQQMAIDQQVGQQKVVTAAIDHSQSLQHAEQTHKQTLAHQETAAKQQAKLKPKETVNG